VEFFGKLLVLQQVADLGEQDLLVGGGGGSGGLGGCGLLLLLLADLGQLVQATDQPEDHQSQNCEIDDGGQEIAHGQVVLDLLNDLSAGGIDDGLVGGLDPGHPGQGDLDLAEISTAQENVDDGHDDVVGQGLGDGVETGTDDGTDSQCHGVALNGKGQEFIPPGGLEFLRHSMYLLSIS